MTIFLKSAHLCLGCFPKDANPREEPFLYAYHRFSALLKFRMHVQLQPFIWACRIATDPTVSSTFS
jgi:hypothetical protein